MLAMNSIRIFLSRNAESINKATATVAINNQLILQGIRMTGSDDNLRILYPTWRNKNNQIRTVVHPSGDFKMQMETELLAAYRKVKDGAEDNTFTFDIDPDAKMSVTNAVVYPYLGRDTAARARVALELDNSLWLRGMALMARDDGSLWLAVPRTELRNGQQMSLYHPLTQEARNMLTDASLPYYEEAVREARKSMANRPASR